ncbi:MAG: Zn-dependent exopeptidase M28 [Halanaerobiales bacterium]|nr:Zn-dependent exopeptidase M28 [Halanaerobiales bacterium]
MSKNIKKTVENHLDFLCNEVKERYVGSQGNQITADYLKNVMKKADFEIKEQHFNCFDWQGKNVIFKVAGVQYQANIGPYSHSVDLKAPLSHASTLEELKKLKGNSKVVLLTGELTEEQLVPKNFPFYNIEKHQEIIRLLEEKDFKAVVAATGQSKDTAGGLYPFPLIEDGDFQVPNIYIKDTVGEKLKKKIGSQVYLHLDTERIDSNGKNIICTKEKHHKNKISLFAHFDSKENSPGAIDNATGVTILLLLADLLKDNELNKTIEIALLNGEDYYSNPGQQIYFIKEKEKLGNIKLGVNIDGIGYFKGKTAFSLYNTEQSVNDTAHNIFSKKYNMKAGKQWYQGEHAILAQQGIPALAFTAELLDEILDKVHTGKDNLKLVDTMKIVKNAQALQQFLLEIKIIN